MEKVLMEFLPRVPEGEEGGGGAVAGLAAANHEQACEQTDLNGELHGKSHTGKGCSGRDLFGELSGLVKCGVLGEEGVWSLAVVLAWGAGGLSRKMVTWVRSMLSP